MAREVVKKVKHAVLYNDGSIRLDNIRFSFPHLDKPYAGKNPTEEEKKNAAYSVVGMLPKKTHEDAKKLCEDRIQELAEENKVRKISKDKRFISDGDEGDRDEQEGHWLVSAREKRKPIVRDMKNMTVKDGQENEVIQAGYWGSILIRPWFQDHESYGKRVNAGLSIVRLLREDETFGAARINDEDADEIMDDEDLADYMDDDNGDDDDDL